MDISLQGRFAPDHARTVVQARNRNEPFSGEFLGFATERKRSIAVSYSARARTCPIGPGTGYAPGAQPGQGPALAHGRGPASDQDPDRLALGRAPCLVRGPVRARRA